MPSMDARMARHGHARRGPHAIRGWSMPSADGMDPRLTPNRKDPLYNSLHQLIFKFCIAKFRRQFTKYWGKIDACGENHGAWRRAQSDFVDETKEDFDRFCRMCRSLEVCAIMLSKLERNPGDEESLDMLIRAISVAYNHSKKVLDSPTDCETWVSCISTDNSQRKFCCVSTVQCPCFCCSYPDLLWQASRGSEGLLKR